MGTTITAGGVSVAPLGVMDLSYDREARTIVHDILDRPDPDVTLRPTGLRAGNLVFLCADDPSRDAVEELHTTAAGVVSLTATDRPRLDGLRYVVTGRLNVVLDSQTRHRWLVTVPYREVS
ncbi:hypothetical protein ACFWGN_04270 [Oerskovia sp. NPDC060338]|uniref:hypothetical protein n=1 Tax=Oerskovia sp. NPDC060338 TaxID=3347100 RepID=UPI00364837D2